MKKNNLIRASVKPVPIDTFQTRPGTWLVFDEQAKKWVKYPTDTPAVPKEVLKGQIDIFGNVYD